MTKMMSMVVRRTANTPTVFQLNSELRYRIIKTAKVNPKTSIRYGDHTAAVPALFMKLKNTNNRTNIAAG